MAFPTTSILDDFNRANTGPPPSANWTSLIFVNDGSGLVVASNAALAGAGSPSSAWWNAATFGPDCECYTTMVDTITTTNDVDAVFARLVTPGGAGPNTDGYSAFYQRVLGGTNSALRLMRWDNGVGTQIASLVIGVTVAGTKIGIECVGSAISSYRTVSGVWTLGSTVTDSVYPAAGYLGLRIIDSAASGWSVDDFGGGTIVAAAGSDSNASGGAMARKALFDPLLVPKAWF